jgi:hypothetical protein
MNNDNDRGGDRGRHQGRKHKKHDRD